MITFEVFQGNDKDWYWRAYAKNGRIVADGAEGYANKSNAIRAIESFMENLRGKGWDIKF